MPKAYKDSVGNPIYEKAWLPENLDGKRKNGNVGVMAYLPSISFKYKKLRIGFVNDLVTLASFEGFEQGFAHASYNGYRKSSNAFNWVRWKNNSYLFNESVAKLNSWVSNGINIAYLHKLQGQKSLMYGATFDEMDHYSQDAATTSASNRIYEEQVMKVKEMRIEIKRLKALDAAPELLEALILANKLIT
jgi:hypothetical protein